MYDYLIVGAGLFGATFAHEAHKKGKKCLVIERRPHIGGNIYTENIEGIDVHKYGPHIFHTDDKAVWEYINSFTKFNSFINSPIANYKGELYNLPFNMNTFSQMWGITTADQAKEIIMNQVTASKIDMPKNLEEQAIQMVGYDIYEKLIKGYTQKQWGKQCHELPASIIKRIPLRFTYNNNYYDDSYQGIPEDGYTSFVEKLLEGIEVLINTDFHENRDYFKKIAKRIVYTGMVDEYYDYCFGYLEYRSLRFENKRIDIKDYQGVAVVNYTDGDIPYTRIIEHKHFNCKCQTDKTIITYEYPATWDKGSEAYYPVNDSKNEQLYAKYISLANQEEKVIFGGRLGMYKYFDMDDTIKEALLLAERELVK